MLRHGLVRQAAGRLEKKHEGLSALGRHVGLLILSTFNGEIAVNRPNARVVAAV